MNERIRINAEDDETGEYIFVNATPETTRNLIAMLEATLATERVET